MTDPLAWMVDQVGKTDLPCDGRAVEPPKVRVGRAALAVRNAVVSEWRTRSDIAALTGAAQNTMAIELRRMEAAGEIEVERGTGKRPDRYRRAR